MFFFSFKHHSINENQVADFSAWFQHDVFGWFLRSIGPQNLFGNFAGTQPEKVRVTALANQIAGEQSRNFLCSHSEICAQERHLMALQHFYVVRR